MLGSIETRFPVMGTTAHLSVAAAAGGASLLAFARSRLTELESLWSRFVPGSDVSRLNRRAGQSVQVAPETLLLVETSVLGWTQTAGRFDPTVLHALAAAGYDRTFREVASNRTEGRDTAPSPGCGGVRVDWRAGTVRLPASVGFDPGGLGKGLAADLVVKELHDAGARRACINVGGDLRVLCTDEDAGYAVAIEHPLSLQTLTTVLIRKGAVASSSRTRRVWRDGVAHHLIDPSTGRPSTSGLSAVSVVAAAAWQAEVLATAAFIAGLGAGARLITGAGAAGVLVDDRGRTTEAGNLRQFLPDPAPVARAS